MSARRWLARGRRAGSKEARLFLLALAGCVLVYGVNAVAGDIQPQSLWGMAYGTAAALLMLGAAWYSMRRRFARAALRQSWGRAQTWLQFHLYGGTLFLVLLFMHTGLQLPHGRLAWWLWGLSLWVTVSGAAGVLLQKWLPRLLSSGLALEVVYERIPELIAEISARAAALVQTCSEPVKDFYREQIALTLAAPQPRWIYWLDITGGIQARVKKFEYVRRLLPAEEQQKLRELESCYRAKLEIDAHVTLQRALRGWLYLHVPASLVLLVLVALHVFAVWYY
ncbi:MAG: hypothetical protein ONB49_03305 [candidate division KSB1 bacterium]|nr:hypothetical protein [candidate division KSB1 bacterium]